jgi:hypothetical protein
MKFSILVFVAAATTGAMAQYTACGHHLVNSGSKCPALGYLLSFSACQSASNIVTKTGYSQADIAWAACGRADTCDGKEWNTLFIYRPIPHGLPSIESKGFCDNGCYEDGLYQDKCH